MTAQPPQAPKPPRIPHGATFDPQDAKDSIAKKPKRLVEAYKYWQQCFDLLTEDVFGPTHITSPAMWLAHMTPNQSLQEQFAERDYLYKLTPSVRARVSQRRVIDNMVRTPSMASIENIAREILPAQEVEKIQKRAGVQDAIKTRNQAKMSQAAEKRRLLLIDRLFECIRAFRKAAFFAAALPLPGPENKLPLDATAKVTQQQLLSKSDVTMTACGIRAARELFDVARRYRYCTLNAKEFGVPFSELLALFMQEGTLCATPPKDSYLHAPLIHTRHELGIARTSIVFCNDTSVSRPGFNLVFKYDPKTMLKEDRETLQAAALVRNLAALGGLDAITIPNLPSGDELVVGLNSYLRSSLKPNTLVMGLAMASVEQFDKLPSFEDFYASVEPQFDTLWDLHPVEPAQSGEHDWCLIGLPYLDQGRQAGAFLENRDDTYACLQVQASWYASRSRPLTLLSRRDRIIHDTIRLPRFFPFVTYLRFHVQDIAFLGILLRTIVRMDDIRGWHHQHASQSSSQAFRDALDRSGYRTSEWKSINENLVTVLKTWKSLQSETESKKSEKWRHIGLLDALGAPDCVLRPQPTPQQLWNEATACSVLSVIDKLQLLDSINLALEHTPFSVLIDLKVVERSKPEFAVDILAKSHSFERLRLAYADVVKRAGLAFLDEGQAA